MIVRYRAIDARGSGRTGQIELDDIPAWVEHKYNTGWRALTVIAYSDGRQVGGITPDLAVPRRRSWWAEVTVP